MKKILMLCLALVMGVGLCAAQKAADKKTVTTVFTTDIDCEHCVKKIMNNVPSLGKGVKDVKVDLPKKEVTVVYDSTKNSDDNIVKGFASIKVKAEPKKADTKKYRRRVLLSEREDNIVLPFVSVVGRAPVLPSVSPDPPGLSVRVPVCFHNIVPAPAQVEVEPCEAEERCGDKDVEQGQPPAFGREIRFGKF